MRRTWRPCQKRISPGHEERSGTARQARVPTAPVESGAFRTDFFLLWALLISAKSRVSKDTAMKMRSHRSLYRMFSPLAALLLLSLLLAFTGCGGAKSGQVSTDDPPAPTVSIAASPASIAAGASSMLTVSATNATTVTVRGSDG